MNAFIKIDGQTIDLAYVQRLEKEVAAYRTVLDQILNGSLIDPKNHDEDGLPALNSWLTHDPNSHFWVSNSITKHIERVEAVVREFSK